MRRVDRASAADARFVLESLIFDEACRLRWLGLLADAMVAAHAVHPASWAVTLFDDGLRLNVGRIETVVFRQGGVMLVLDSARFSDDELNEIRLHRMRGAIDLYTSVRGTVAIWGGYQIDGETTVRRREALLTLVGRAASRVRTRTSYARFHSPG